MTKPKLNPRRRPATEADVDRAFEDGITAGVSNASAIFLTVLVDKFNGADHIAEVWREIQKLCEEIVEKRVSIADLRKVLREEYGIEV